MLPHSSIQRTELQAAVPPRPRLRLAMRSCIRIVAMLRGVSVKGSHIPMKITVRPVEYLFRLASLGPKLIRNIPDYEQVASFPDFRCLVPKLPFGNDLLQSSALVFAHGTSESLRNTQRMQSC